MTDHPMLPLLLATILLGSVMIVFLRCTPAKVYKDKVDATSGYNDLDLDAPYELLKGRVEMKLVLDDPCRATKKYQVTSENYAQIGGVRFHTVQLEFVHDSLYRTTLNTKDTYEARGQLRTHYRQEFGEPQEEKAVTYKITKWVGKNHSIHIADRLKSDDLEVEYTSLKGRQRSLEAEKACGEPGVKNGSL